MNFFRKKVVSPNHTGIFVTGSYHPHFFKKNVLRKIKNVASKSQKLSKDLGY